MLRTLFMRILIGLMLWLLLTPLFSGFSLTEEGHETPSAPYSRVYIIEARGTMLGYSLESCEISEDPKIRLYKTRTLFQTGAGETHDPVRALFKAEYRVEADSGRVLGAHIEHYQGKAYEIRDAVFLNRKVEIRTVRHKGKASLETLLIPEDVVVPYSSAVPALLLMNAGKDEERFSFLDLVAGKVETVTVRQRGEETLEYGGKPCDCKGFTIDWGDRYREAHLWITGDGALAKKEMPIQGMVFSPASKKAAAQVLPSEKELSPFLPVAATIKSRPTLTYLMLRARIFCPSVEEAAALHFENQTFDGRVEDGFIEGVFKIRSFYLDRTRSEGFPVGPEEVAGFAPYLQSAPSMESDDPRIMQTAQELTQDLQKRWHAAHSLGVGVLKLVSYVPEGESSALAALSAKQADALGLTRLHVALCRSLQIPARVIRGAIYSLVGDSAGFVEHAWSEVFLGAQGWVPMDVTAGALTFLDAGHLRLGTAAQFRPVEIEIMDYIPKSEEERPEALRIARDFPMARGETHLYDYYINDEPWGTEKITYRGKEKVNRQTQFVFTSSLDLKTLKGTSTSRTLENGCLVSYDANLGEVSCTCRVEGKEVLCTIRQGESVQEKREALPREGFFFDTHQIFQRGFMLSRLQIEVGEVIQISALQPAVMRSLTLQVERKSDITRKINGKTGHVQVFELLGSGQRMRILLSPEGLLLEETEVGGLSRVVWRGVE